MTTMIEKLETLAKSIKETNDSYEDEVTDIVDEALDMMLDYDYFGTEGQLDPRGDRRNTYSQGYCPTLEEAAKCINALREMYIENTDDTDDLEVFYLDALRELFDYYEIEYAGK